MRKPRQRSIEIRDYVLENVSAHPEDITVLTADQFDISRPAVLRHIHKLLDEGLLIAHGTTRDRRYELTLLVNDRFSIGLSPDVEEDKIWRHLVYPLLRELSTNVLSICEYGMNEIANNAIDHSEGTELEIRVQQSAASIDFMVRDNGIGIFNKIKSELQLGELREAILELSKGKLTTDPDRHTGEGIFFVSKMFDSFVVASEGLHYAVSDFKDENLPQAGVSDGGTEVAMSISALSNRTPRQVFDRYASDDFDYTFSKTKIPVALAKLGTENLVSRSQARRLLTRLNEFESITLDFDGVESIGQPFADEVFRVYARNNPEVEITTINSNEAVTRMVRRARSGLS
jgi:anti-sigma regulatory factor (Ser/Thr protein kinase)